MADDQRHGRIFGVLVIITFITSIGAVAHLWANPEWAKASHARTVSPLARSRVRFRPGL